MIFLDPKGPPVPMSILWSQKSLRGGWPTPRLPQDASRWPLAASRRPQDRPKRLHDASKMTSREHTTEKKTRCFSAMLFACRQICSQEVPRLPQDGPQRFEYCLNIAQDGHKVVPGGPKMFKIAQDGPTRPRDAPKRPRVGANIFRNLGVSKLGSHALAHNIGAKPRSNSAAGIIIPGHYIRDICLQITYILT